MKRALLRTMPLVAPIVLAAACAPAARSAETGPRGVCEGGRAVLVVRNYSGRDVEIVESGRGSSSVIAVVAGGRHEVGIRNLPGLSYLARPVGSLYFPRRDRSVRMERECR